MLFTERVNYESPTNDIYLAQHHHIASRAHAEATGDKEQEESEQDLARCRPKVFHRCNEAQRRLDDCDDCLAEEDEEEDHEVEARVRLEGFVGGPVPAHERGGREEECKDHSRDKVLNFAVGQHQDQGTHDVDEEHSRVQYPNVVQVSDGLLELDSDLLVDVVVETGLEATLLRQRWPIVQTSCATTTRVYLSFPTIQLGGLSVQLSLSPVKLLQTELGSHLRGTGRRLTRRHSPYPCLAGHIASGQWLCSAHVLVFVIKRIVVLQTTLLAGGVLCYLLYGGVL